MDVVYSNQNITHDDETACSLILMGFFYFGSNSNISLIAFTDSCHFSR